MRAPPPLQSDAAQPSLSLDQVTFVLNGAQFDTFVASLQNPCDAGPKLKALMSRKPMWAVDA